MLSNPRKSVTLLAAVFGMCLLMNIHAAPVEALEYPAAATGDTLDDYGGVMVADPYRWLEDLSSPETTAWVEAQNKLTFGFLNQIEGRDRLLKRLIDVVNYERYSLPSHTAGRYFFSKNDGLQNQYVQYVSEGLDGEPRVLLDPNTWSADGTVALAGEDISDDAKWLLYATSSSGSDWVEWHVKSIDSGENLPDVIKWSKGGGTWNRDASGFWYGRYPEPKPGEEFTAQNFNPMVYFHKLGTPQSEDQLVFSLPEHPDWWLSAGLNEERDLMTIYIGERGSQYNRLYFKDLSKPDAPVEKIFDANDAQYGLVTNTGRIALMQTTKDAPNQRVVQVDLDNPDPANWKTIIPESEMALQGVGTVGGYLFASYLKDAHTATYKYRLNGELVSEVRFPGPGSAGGFGGRKGDKETFYSYGDFVTPSSAFRYNVETGESTLYRKSNVTIDTSRFETQQVFYRAKDGTAVPMFLVYRKGTKLDGSNPTLLDAYGGFNLSYGPYFSTAKCVWMEMGGVYAFACIRGGGEYGERWHLAATKEHKQVSFDDMISAAQFLIEKGYCTPKTLACSGWSNGGMMIGAVVNQRPDLFAVALPGTGVMDMLRFNQFGYGSGWEDDYGSPQDPAMFPYLYAISPYHNIRPGGQYPAVMVFTADTDDRVMPGHSYKYTARLQAAVASDSPPVLIRVETKAGHGAGLPLAKQLAQITDEYAFTLHNMGKSIPASFD